MSWWYCNVKKLSLSTKVFEGRLGTTARAVDKGGDINELNCFSSLVIIQKWGLQKKWLIH
jgi:hypothetical protein